MGPSETHKTDKKRVYQEFDFQGRTLILREAFVEDVHRILELFSFIYQGKYPLEFGHDPRILKAEISDDAHFLWLVVEDNSAKLLVGAMMFQFDTENRLGKAAGAVVHQSYRQAGLGLHLIQAGTDYLTKSGETKQGLVDVIYGTTRTATQGPSRLVEEAGFHKLGLFPNAIQIEHFEHLNLDIFLTDRALKYRRKKPYLFQPFNEVYQVAQKQLGLERAVVVNERAPLKLSKKKINLRLIDDSREVLGKFRSYGEQKRLSNSFFPFHVPNWILASEDGGTEVFIWYGGVGKQAAIVSYRTDRVNIHDLLDSSAQALQMYGAAYVELLVNAYDYMLQQEAYTARYIPSAYFPSMRLAVDGQRDDFFVLSRTFRLLDFTDTCVRGDNYKFLQAYLRCYNELYIRPFLENRT